jgi:hypothetical protein
MSLLSRLLSSKASLHKKLRKATANGKLRNVADLLDAGASPTWMEEGVDSTDEMNALLLACHGGRVEIIDLMLDAFFDAPQILNLWGRHMYCVVIRSGHWEAFRRIYDRKVPLDSGGSMRSKLPAPMFIAAESGQSQILQFLIRNHPHDAVGYSFNGHSLLSIASKNGHYDCVEVLLSMFVVTDEMLDFAMDVARTHSQAHVLVLLTTCLPQYNSNPRPLMSSRHSSVTLSLDKDSSYNSLFGHSSTKPQRSSQSQKPHHHNRWSLADTDILSDYGDERDRGSSVSQQLQRRSSSMWLYPQSGRDLVVYDPYLESDDDEMAYDADAARQYEAYIQGIEGTAVESDIDWTTTPPVSSTGMPFMPRARRSLSVESEEKTHGANETLETLMRIAERRELAKTENLGQGAKKQRTWFYHNEVILPYSEEKQKKKPSTWFYHDEVILPYDESDESAAALASVEVAPSLAPPMSAKPPIPPSSKNNHSSRLPSTITQVSRKVISVRSKHMLQTRASM